MRCKPLRKSIENLLYWAFLSQPLYIASWVSFQYPIRCLILMSREVSKPRDLYLKLSDSSEIWQASRQLCCRCACQTSKRCDNLKLSISWLRDFMRSHDKTSYRILKRDAVVYVFVNQCCATPCPLLPDTIPIIKVINLIQLISPWTKWLPFRRRYFHMHFSEWKVLYFDYNFTEVCS